MGTQKGIIFAVGVIIIFLIFSFYSRENSEIGDDGSAARTKNVTTIGSFDVSNSSIDVSKIVSGGPRKDGIPSIDNPKFISISQTKEKGDYMGILLTLGDESRWYPYSILVWHEIVNDSFGGKEVAVTFCPLCATGIVYNRSVNGETLSFGVSGLLHQSNLLMYDRQTESLWSQSKGEAVTGKLIGEKLSLLPFQLISFKEVKDRYPEAKILSRETGHSRDYDYFPYGNYNENDNLYFSVDTTDSRFHKKELMYVFPFENTYHATPFQNLIEGDNVFSDKGNEIVIKLMSGEVEVYVNGVFYPGYFEQWFSFVAQHRGYGVVLERLEN